MTCCGGKRAALKQQAKTLQSSNTRMVRYTGKVTVTVQGPVTGKQYTFSPQLPLQYVDVRDAVYFSQIPQLQQ
jgi:hypothetical protein